MVVKLLRCKELKKQKTLLILIHGFRGILVTSLSLGVLISPRLISLSHPPQFVESQVSSFEFYRIIRRIYLN